MAYMSRLSNAADDERILQILNIAIYTVIRLHQVLKSNTQARTAMAIINRQYICSHLNRACNK